MLIAYRAMELMGFVLLFLAAAVTTAADGEAPTGVRFTVHNAAPNAPGGRGFDAVFGRVLQEATSEAWRLFKQNNSNHKPVVAITLTVDEHISGDRTASTRGGDIEISAEFLAGLLMPISNIREEGLLFHEVAQVWQYDGDGRANAALLEGIDDLVRLRRGHREAYWVQPGQGVRWDQRGDGVTARFFEHLEEQKPGLVAAVNAGLKKQVPNGGLDLFKRITGKSVTRLWAEYKAAYAA